MVLAGEAGPALLDTYSTERRPIGWLRHQQTFARPDYRRWVGDALAGETLYGSEAMELGQRVASAAVIAPDDALPPAAAPDVWRGQPGTRVPHVWVTQGGRRVSTIDLFTRRLSLVTCDARWTGAAKMVSTAMGVPIAVARVGSDILFPADVPFGTTFGERCLSGASGCDRRVAILRHGGQSARRPERRDRTCRRIAGLTTPARASYPGQAMPTRMAASSDRD